MRMNELSPCGEESKDERPEERCEESEDGESATSMWETKSDFEETLRQIDEFGA